MDGQNVMPNPREVEPLEEDIDVESLPSTLSLTPNGTAKASTADAKTADASTDNASTDNGSTDGPKAAYDKDQGNGEYEPPKPNFTPFVEEGSVCTMRCKVFIKKADPKDPFDTSYQDRGVGMLYVKPVSHGKAQLVVRADNSLGNIILNVCITAEIPIEVANDTTLMLVCRPMPGDLNPRTVLLRVKTPEEQELLHEKLIII